MAVIRILTLNANAGFDIARRRFLLPALRDAVHGVDADVVCLQEVLGRHSGHARRHTGWPGAAQHEYLAGSLWPHHAYGRNAVFPEGHLGNALLSKYPIVRFDNLDVSIPSHEPRGLLHAVLRVPRLAVPVHVVCVHMGLREPHRRQQFALLVRLVDAGIPADVPLIVAGDFNDWRMRGHASLRRAGLREAFEDSTGRVARSFPARWPLLPLDRIYVRNARVASTSAPAGLPWSHLSDHAPLFAEIRVAGRDTRDAEAKPRRPRMGSTQS